MRSFSFVGGVVDTILRPFNWGVSAERDNAISVQADPLIDNPKVYEAYIRFLNTDVPLGRRNAIEESDEGIEVNKVTSTTIDPTIVKKTIVSQPAVDPAATNAPATFATTTETTETSAAASTSEEGKPKTKPHKIDLVIRSFDFNTLHALRRAQSAPSSAEVIIGPKPWKDGWYYWVPKQYQKEFFALCMAVVARGDNSEAGAEKSDAVKALKENSAILRRGELR